MTLDTREYRVRKGKNKIQNCQSLRAQKKTNKAKMVTPTRQFHPEETNKMSPQQCKQTFDIPINVSLKWQSADNTVQMEPAINVNYH